VIYAVTKDKAPLTKFFKKEE